MNVHPRLNDIDISGIRKMAERIARTPGALSLAIGQPDFPTPGHIIEAAKRALDTGKTGYTPNAGVPELREAACRFVNRKYGLDYRPEETIVTVGAAEAIDLTFRTLLRDGDEVVLPAPVYPGYEPVVRLCGAVPVFVDTRSTGFKLTAEHLERHLTPRTRCVVLPYPSNPTGQTMDRRELENIANLLRDINLFVVSDEIYSELVFYKEHVSMASLPGMRDKTVVVNGLSKSHAMTGFRIGFVFAPEGLIRQMLKMHQYAVTCAPTVSQYAAIEALTNGFDDAAPMREEYARRAAYACRRLRAFGFDVVEPEATFYLFPSILPFGLPSETFAVRLLEEEKVGIVPGNAFSPIGEGYVRLSCACPPEQLEQALDRIGKFVSRL